MPDKMDAGEIVRVALYANEAAKLFGAKMVIDDMKLADIGYSPEAIIVIKKAFQEEIEYNDAQTVRLNELTKRINNDFR